MKSTPILALVILAGLFGWFAPDLSGGTSPAPETPPAASRPAADPGAAMVPAGEVVLPRAGDGHFYAEVSVEGVPSRMLVDTGASVLALTGEDAEAMGIEWRPEDVLPVARGAGGVVYGVPVTLGEVQLGDLEARSVAAVVVPEGLGISLLGQSFLSHVERVEIDGERMVLGS